MLKILAAGLMISVLIGSMIMILQLAYAKGLKVYLTIDSNQPAQQASIGTYQYGDNVKGRDDLYFINQGITELTLQYQKGQVENGNFDICVSIVGLQSCGKGYDGPEKKPVNVHVSLQGGGDHTPMQLNDNSQAQSSSNNNVNNNDNSLSQSQATTIYICKENGCTAQ